MSEGDHPPFRAVIGKALPRIEDIELTRGEACYLDDLSVPDALVAFVVRSPVARGLVRKVDTKASRAVPGVKLVLTAEDVAAAGISELPLDVLPPRDSVPSGWSPPCQPVLAREEVRFVGEPVGFVVADNTAAGLDAAEAFIVEIDEREPVVDLSAALSGAGPVDTAFPGNEVLAFERGDAVGTARAFADAARVETLSLVEPRVIASPLEPRGCLARHEDGRFFLTVGTQRPFGMRDLLADHVFRVPRADVVVRVPHTGGGFGLKNALYPEYVLCLHAARLLRRPVKWVADRRESFLSDNHARENLFTLEAAVDEDSRIAAIRARRHVALGAYTAPRTMVPIENGTTHLTGVYAIPAAHVRTSAHLTNTACTSSYRGAGRPEHVYACERFTDVLARRLGQDPIAFRRRNLLSPDTAAPTALGSDYRGLAFAKILDRALERLGSGPRKAVRQGMLPGRGVCLSRRIFMDRRSPRRRPSSPRVGASG